MAFTDKGFPPILMVGKLLPLQVNKENNKSKSKENVENIWNYLSQIIV